MKRLKKEDLVMVITGKSKGKTGRVKQLIEDRGQVIIERVNMVKRHRKATKEAPGGIEEKEAPIQVSNVMLVDPKTKEPTRIRHKIINDKKVRIAIKSGEVLGK